MTALRITCTTLAVIFAFVGLLWLIAAVLNLLTGGGLGGGRIALIQFGVPLLLLDLSAAAFALRCTILAPRGMLARAEERVGVPLAIYTLVGTLVGAGVSSVLVVRWDVPDWVGLPLTTLCILVGVVVGFLRMKPPRGLEGRCPEWGYDLRGSPGPRCPECGNPFDPDLVRAPHEEADDTDSP